MISFIQLPYRQGQSDRQRDVRSVAVGFVFGLLITVQLGLLAWAVIQ